MNRKTSVALRLFWIASCQLGCAKGFTEATPAQDAGRTPNVDSAIADTSVADTGVADTRVNFEVADAVVALDASRDANAGRDATTIDAQQDASIADSRVAPAESGVGGDGGALVVRRAFVTAQRRNGNFGGLLGTDAFCQLTASNAGLPGRWYAFIHDDDYTVIVPADRYVSMNGAPLFRWINNDTQFVPETGMTQNVATESGVLLRTLQSTSDWPVWTGMDGMSVPYSCYHWTSNVASYHAEAGNILSTTNFRSNGRLSCASLASLLCVEQ